MMPLSIFCICHALVNKVVCVCVCVYPTSVVIASLPVFPWQTNHAAEARSERANEYLLSVSAVERYCIIVL